MKNQPSDFDALKHDRHDLSSAILFLETAFDEIQAQAPSSAESKSMYSAGLTRLQHHLSKIDAALDGQAAKDGLTYAKSLGYNTTVESTFTDDHHEILEWRKRFEEETRIHNIFQEIEHVIQQLPEASARLVGIYWYEFSAIMPWFLSQAAAMVSTNEMRHYVVQTAFEELGMRNVSEIHPELFWQAAKLSNCTDAERVDRICKGEPSIVLAALRQQLLRYTSDGQVLGILLGLEIPAKENIDTIFNALGYSPAVRSSLESSKFFKLHREIESEHVRLTVANFLRFCTTEQSRNDFISGFGDGIEFWKKFWSSVTHVILAEREQSNHA